MAAEFVDYPLPIDLLLRGVMQDVEADEPLTITWNFNVLLSQPRSPRPSAGARRLWALIIASKDLETEVKADLDYTIQLQE